MSEQKIEQFWRDATADDVARVVRGETIEARFAISKGDWSGKEWVEFSTDGICLRLGGWSEGFWVDSDGDDYKQCQVYDPPAWFLNKPDPGEGWRLLEKFPPEPIIGTDDYWSTAKAKWMPIVKLTTNKQPEKTWFRRRIEANPTQCFGRVCALAQPSGVTCPHDTCDLETGVRKANNPETPDSSNSSETPNSCRSREDIPSGWRLLGKDEERLASDAYWSLGAKDWVIIGDNRVAIANMLPRGRDIRQVDHQADYTLLVGFTYPLPNGQTIRVTAKGFEVV